LSNLETLSSHLSQNHVVYKQKEYICEWLSCLRKGKPFPSRQKLLRHLSTHTGDRPLVCETCQQKFSDSTGLKRHVESQHSNCNITPTNSMLTCPQKNCSKQFSHLPSLQGHIYRMHREKRFQCQYKECQKEFKESSSLSKHSKIHLSKRNYGCPRCDDTFTRSDLAKRQIKLVHKELEIS
jgi:uncharacterized Zn-finger protein